MKKDAIKTIAFYLQDGVEVLDFAGPMEVFSYAGFNVFTVSEFKKPIKSQGILTIIPDYSVENAPKADIIAFFGGNSTPTVKNKTVIDWVKSQHVDYHFSVCTGAFILAEAEILNGHTATTFHSALSDFEKNYPKVNVRKDVRYVDNGKVITTAGVSAGIDGALHLVAKLRGINAAKRTAYYMEYDNWNVGDGLLLTDDNPYETLIPKEDLLTYVGTYEHKNNKNITLKINASGELIALIAGVEYPLFEEDHDTFSDINGEPVRFKRNDENKIIGYSINSMEKVYKKL